MTISLEEKTYTYTTFTDEELEVYLTNGMFVDWLDMNWSFIAQAIEEFCYNDVAWCCCGMFSIDLDILEIFKNAPYDLARKHRILNPNPNIKREPLLVWACKKFLAAA